MPRTRRNPVGRLLGALFALVLVVAVVGAAAALVDNEVRTRSERSVEQQVTQQYAGTGVQVRLSGWPFLWQVHQDRLDGGSLRAAAVTVDAGGHRVVLRNLALQGTDLTGVRDQQHIVVGQVTGSVDVPWSTVRELTGVDLAYVSADRVRLSENLDVLGQQLPVTIEGTPRLDPATGELGIRDATATVAGTAVPKQLLEPLLARVGTGYRLPPLGALHYRSITPGPDAVRVGLAGTDVDAQQVLG